MCVRPLYADWENGWRSVSLSTGRSNTTATGTRSLQIRIKSERKRHRHHRTSSTQAEASHGLRGKKHYSEGVVIVQKNSKALLA